MQRSDSLHVKSILHKTIAYLDSCGYLHPRYDTVSHLQMMVYPQKRAVLVAEQIRYAQMVDNRHLVPGSPLTFPRPFTSAEITLRAVNIARYFMGRGYPYTKVFTDFEPSSTPDSLILAFMVDTDSLYHFAAPRLQGVFTLRKKYLLNDILVEAGAPFSVEIIDRSLQRLRSRRYIADAVAGPPIIESTSDVVRTDTGCVTVPFVVTDRSGMGLDGALGFEIRESNAPQLHGNLEFSFVNMFRAAEEASLSYRGDKTEQRLGIDVTRPWFLGLPLQVSASGGLEIEQDAYGYVYGAITALYESALWWRIGTKITATSISGNSGNGWTDGSFTGIDLVLLRDNEPLSDGSLSRSIYLATGSGVTKKGSRYSRSHLDFSAMVHLPFLQHQALLLRGVTGHIVTKESSMLPAELYRAGGNFSLRGYGEDEFAFKTILRGQSEYLYYFQKNASVYLLCDGGIGFTGAIGNARSYTRMLGYGVGLRIPVATGTFSLAWARSIDDQKSPGRVHVRLQNPLSTLYGRGISVTGK